MTATNLLSGPGQQGPTGVPDLDMLLLALLALGLLLACTAPPEGQRGPDPDVLLRDKP